MFYPDKPINLDKDDKLGRVGFAKLLAQSFLKLDNIETFSVGLFGEWGSGKTSIVNMMLNEIREQQKDMCKEKKPIVIHFEPWNFSDTNQLLMQFFIRLSNEFRSKGDKKLTQIGDAIEKYSDAFEFAKSIPVVGGLLSFIGKSSAIALGKKMKKGANDKDILKQKEFVVNLLKNQSNKILVIIDDIDRLNNEQIRQVFQLITSVAKFPNTIYLLVFDKNIVVKALEKVQEGSGEDYLDKIIQMPIQIPNVQREKLRQVLFAQLNEILSNYKEIYFLEDYWQRLYKPCISPFFNNIRDINRLCNSVQFKLSTISSEINFTDMVAISALEIQTPKVYEWIKVNKPLLTGDFDISSFERNDKTQQQWYDFYNSQIQGLIQNSSSNKKGVKNSAIIIQFLSYLFPYFGQKIGQIREIYDLNVFRRNNQIAHPEKFERYFSLDLNENALKKSEILNAVQMLNCKDFGAFLLEQDKKDISYEFLEEVKAMLPEISQDRAKIIIKALIDTSTQLDMLYQKSYFFSIRASSLADHMVIDLLDIIATSERFSFFSNIILNAELTSLPSTANIINMLELAYGRLAAGGQERNYKKVITLEELLQLEVQFLQKVIQILKEHSLFDFNDWNMVYYLLECFNPNFVKTYLEAAFSDDSNVIKYMDISIVTWTGDGTQYEIKGDYKKYLTEERVLQAIKTQKESGVIFSLSDQIQNKCGAFYLYTSDKQNYHGNISQSDVDELLTEWKCELNCE